MMHVTDRLGWGVAGAALATAVGVAALRGNPATNDGPDQLAVTCAPGQQAIVTRDARFTNGPTTVRCVSSFDDPEAMVAGAATQPWRVRAGQAYSTPASYAMPVAPMSTPAAAAVAPVPAAVAPVQRVTASRSSAPRQAARQERGSSWQKKALVIGGTAGAGAGLGALIGGKKGAAIGAAAGGGGATLYELLKRDDR